GKVAQFGRGVMADVSSALLGQFVTSLESEVLGERASVAEGAAAPPTGAPGSAAVDAGGNGAVPEAGPATAPAESGPRTIAHREVEPVDLLQTAGSPVAKR